MPDLTIEQLTGQDASHLVAVTGDHHLQPQAAEAFLRLQAQARLAGFELAIASSYRSYQRQLAIFNGKARGERPVHDDAGAAVNLQALTDADKLAAILRFSALPGTSRHHWGTDLDVFDAGAVPEDYRLQLTPDEVTAGGPFCALHDWLDARMAADDSCGFYRPYGQDLGGVAPERWHLSYAPLSAPCDGRVTANDLLELWGDSLALGQVIAASVDEILARYVRVAEGWCPRATG
ncbi:M15 family metallopeptidase [Pseudohalioglobus lutimaris]|uniref:Peptidase n=1 Tax=Pseudohalioglobus lutimaris TaxID=1737061 RepID=A0A2N5X0B7_9GAMM|nr:M15 family metallopeptidase [Pseudohalioglobus lutimaris]PLW67922.1 peptidase [Pseudohalioglobus lutimaris]